VSKRNIPAASAMLRSATTALPGIAAAAAIAAVAFFVSGLTTQIPLNPIMLAVVLGTLVAGVAGTPARIAAGLNAVPRFALRVAIVLLGFQISLAELAGLGAAGLAAVFIGTASTMAATFLAGRAMGFERNVSLLIAAGTSICGVAAIVAMAAAVRANARDTSYAIICVTLFGLAAMVLFPLAAPLLGMSERAFGIWAGAGIHEVAQVVAAGFQHSTAAGEIATVTKLARVVLLAPMIAAVLYFLRREATEPAPSILPWFVVGFMLAVFANSLVVIPPELRGAISLATGALFAFALAAIGLSSDPRQFFSGRGREMALGLFSALWIAAVTLAVVFVAG
jgi:uncharacterized integral membrane protein (TIGR00698 family)